MTQLPSLRLAALFICICFSVQAANISRPNIILIVGDDIGFSDIGCYGSEIETPNLDRLADEGMRFTQFHNMGKCNPTRSSIMTGLYRESGNVRSLPQTLRNSGYHTVFVGKEHLDKWVPQEVYAKKSFDRHFISPFSPFLLPEDGSYPRYTGDRKNRAAFRLNNQTLDVHELETSKPFHKTDATTDYTLKLLNEWQSTDKPLFLYLAYHAAHFPLQAPSEDIAKYKSVYSKGWDKIRQDRFAKQKQLGIISPDAKLSQPTDNINKKKQFYSEDNLERRLLINQYRSWKSLSTNEQQALCTEMAVFAAMVDRMDRNIGRIIDWLDRQEARDNTLILFFSDNGSCPYDFNENFDYPPGPAEGFRSLSAPWANVGNTPFRYFKQYGHQGGILTHMIANWPNQINPNQINETVSHVVDLLPTLAEIGDAEINQPALPGISLAPSLTDNTKQPRPYLFGGYKGFYSFRVNDWKIVQTNDHNNWELYNLSTDPSETTNLAMKRPQKVKDLKESLNQHIGFQY